MSSIFCLLRKYAAPPLIKVEKEHNGLIDSKLDVEFCCGHVQYTVALFTLGQWFGCYKAL